jgi:hypothetical protein
MMQVEQIATVDLIPYARNSRTHSDEQVAQVAASIREFGFTNPVLIDQDNGIIAGHGRVMAATRLKLDTVPCIRLSHLSDTQKRAYIIADNKLALNSGWDDEMLKLELMDLNELGFDVALTGFDAEFLEDEAIDDFEPELNSNDRDPIRNMTFTVSDEQHEIIEECLKIAKEFEPNDPMGINENSNGNALWYICETFKTTKGIA